MDFTLNIQAIEKMLTKSLRLVNSNKNAKKVLLSIDNIIRDIYTNNAFDRLSSNSSKFAAKLINGHDLLDVNKSCVVKSKNRSIEARNKKDTIIRTEKTKTRFIKRDFSSFKHVDATIKVSRNNKRTIERHRRDSRDKTRKNKQKESKIDDIVAIDAHIQTFNQNIDKIYENIRDIITRQAIKKETKKTTAIFAIFAVFAVITTTINKIIEINNDDEFDANNNDNANSNNK